MKPLPNNLPYYSAIVYEGRIIEIKKMSFWSEWRCSNLWTSSGVLGRDVPYFFSTYYQKPGYDSRHGTTVLGVYMFILMSRWSNFTEDITC